MTVSYVIVVAVVTYILGAFTKLKWSSLPNKYIPVQNVIIAIISALICFFTKVESNFINSFVLCFAATMGAGGVADLVKVIPKSSKTENE